MSETHELIDHLRELNPDFDRDAVEFSGITEEELHEEVSSAAFDAAAQLYRAADDEALLHAAHLNQKILDEGVAPRFLLVMSRVHGKLIEQVMQERGLGLSNALAAITPMSQEQVERGVEDRLDAFRKEVRTIPTEILEKALRRSEAIGQHAVPGTIRQHVNALQQRVLIEELRERKG